MKQPARKLLLMENQPLNMQLVRRWFAHHNLSSLQVAAILGVSIPEIEEIFTQKVITPTPELFRLMQQISGLNGPQLSEQLCGLLSAELMEN